MYAESIVPVAGCISHNTAPPSRVRVTKHRIVESPLQGKPDHPIAMCRTSQSVLQIECQCQLTGAGATVAA